MLHQTNRTALELSLCAAVMTLGMAVAYQITNAVRIGIDSFLAQIEDWVMSPEKFSPNQVWLTLG